MTKEGRSECARKLFDGGEGEVQATWAAYAFQLSQTVVRNNTAFVIIIGMWRDHTQYTAVYKARHNQYNSKCTVY